MYNETDFTDKVINNLISLVLILFAALVMVTMLSFITNMVGEGGATTVSAVEQGVQVTVLEPM
ncbi:hypothetical protein N9L26_02300 [Candidatus Pacebacteria bacterium]|nr:hypothetical protein [Candidatus Paceibacterota bacterium]